MRTAPAPQSRSAPEPSPGPAARPGLQALAAAAQALQRGLLVFDSDARVLAHNAAAARMLEDDAQLALVPLHGVPGGALRLVSADASLQSAIEQAVHDCAMPASTPIFGLETPAAARALQVGRTRSAPGLVLHLCALRETERADFAGEAAVTGTLVDLSRRPSIESTKLAQLFDLSVSSARVAEAYLRVDSVKEAARVLGISTNTVKTHLATVYERTGCSRQSQLVRLLMALSDGEAR